MLLRSLEDGTPEREWDQRRGLFLIIVGESCTYLKYTGREGTEEEARKPSVPLMCYPNLQNFTEDRNSET